jgi:tRNA pseudouridine55 synthase
MPSVDGLILLRKPENITSFSALNRIKKCLHTRKIGHTGTLDKFAEGLLVVLAGKYTRLASFISDGEKRYRAVLEFGKETSTLDPEGEIIKTAPIPDFEVLQKHTAEFTGTIIQRPPVFSALHIAGERAYTRALRGEDVDMPERKVTVRSFQILDYSPPFLRVEVYCGKGTYIRSLARDFAYACGSCAYLVKLDRTGVGPFGEDEAVAPEDFVPDSGLKHGVDFFRGKFPENIAVVQNRFAEDISRGKQIRENFFMNTPSGSGPFLVFSENDDLIAFIDRANPGFSYRFVAA